MFLENESYWYEQELLLLRDKIFSHGKTMVTMKGVSPQEGVRFRPMTKISPLKARPQENLSFDEVKIRRVILKSERYQ
jgi:hypothetical protein